MRLVRKNSVTLPQGLQDVFYFLRAEGAESVTLGDVYITPNHQLLQ